MPKRQPKPFWRKQLSCFYVQIDGKFHRLDPDEGKAHALYHQLMADRATGAGGQPINGGLHPSIHAHPSPASSPAIDILEEFLEWIARNRSKGTHTIYKHYVVDFGKSLPPGLKVADLKPYHLTKALDAHPDWSSNTRGNYIRTVKNAFNWAASEGYIEHSPIAKVKGVAYQPRETIVSPDEFTELMAAVAYPQARDLIQLAYETGSRPQELRAIEARHVQGDRIQFPRVESKGKKYARTIYLGTEKALEIVGRLSKINPSGPILRNSEGLPWNKNSINCLFTNIEKKIGKRFHLGALRKSFATEAIKNGVDPLTTAHLLGHRDTTMISKVYARVQQDTEHMAEAAKQAKTPKPKPKPKSAS